MASISLTTKNEITKLTTGDSENYYVAAGDNIGGGRDMKAMAHAVGHPASSFYVYQQVYDENGKPIENEFVDRNGDGTINGDDRYFYKKADSRRTYGTYFPSFIQVMGFQFLTARQPEQLCV